MGLVVALEVGLQGILSGLTGSNDHPIGLSRYLVAEGPEDRSGTASLLWV